jgi:hypothetical protein
VTEKGETLWGVPRGTAVLRRLRQTAPAALVPLAWGFVAAAHLDLVSRHAVVVSHVVMCAILLAFTALSWSEMRSGVLFVWRLVLLLGFAITALGLVGLTTGVGALLSITVVGWMLVPGVALAYTGRAGAPGTGIYLWGAALSLLGALGYLAGLLLATEPLLLAGLLTTGIGQTAGIANAVYREA